MLRHLNLSTVPTMPVNTIGRLARLQLTKVNHSAASSKSVGVVPLEFDFHGRSPGEGNHENLAARIGLTTLHATTPM